MTDEEIQTKSAVWRMIGELGFDEARKRLSEPHLKVWKNDPESLRVIADTLDAEADSWAVSFAASVKGEWQFPNDEYGKEAHARYLRLLSASRRLREMSLRIDRQFVGKPLPKVVENMPTAAVKP